MSQVFAIGDIHGCSKTFQKLLTEKIRIHKSDKIYCVGDYVDRGNDSKGVIDFTLSLREKGYEIHTLRGNHEQLMIDSVKSEDRFNLWMKNGGDVTLKSFNASSYNELKPVYREFFSRTKYFIESGQFIFVHAGLNFQKANLFEDKEAMLWIRDFPVDEEKLGKRIIIHGHTPESMDFILKQQDKNVINIDGGCVYVQHEGLGNLVALNVTERKFISVRNIDT